MGSKELRLEMIPRQVKWNGNWSGHLQNQTTPIKAGQTPRTRSEVPHKGKRRLRDRSNEVFLDPAWESKARVSAYWTLTQKQDPGMAFSYREREQSPRLTGTKPGQQIFIKLKSHMQSQRAGKNPHQTSSHSFHLCLVVIYIQTLFIYKQYIRITVSGQPDLSKLTAAPHKYQYILSI